MSEVNQLKNGVAIATERVTPVRWLFAPINPDYAPKGLKMLAAGEAQRNPWR